LIAAGLVTDPHPSQFLNQPILDHPVHPVVWGAIPLVSKKRILANVFCVKCESPAQMVDFSGKLEKHADLILTGKCSVCGHKVVRLLETSEIRNENN